MKISNIRIEKQDNISRLVCDVDCAFSSSKHLWFEVDSLYENWLTDEVYDAFMVAAIYPCMFYNESLVIEGYVSHDLYRNIIKDIQYIIKAYRPEMNLITVTVNGFKKPQKKGLHVGTGFSAGIDSLVTLWDRYEKEQDLQYKIDTLFFFNVGSHGGGGEYAKKKFIKRYEYLKPVPESLGLPFIKLDSNLFDYYLHEWEFDAGIFCRATAILVFETQLSIYYISADNSYYEHMRFLFNLNTTDLSSIAETFLHPLLSPGGLSIVTDGEQYSRTEKTKKIIDYWPTKKYLNVCVNSYDSVANCSICHKCLRTLFCLDAMGKLDDFSNLFDLTKYYKRRFKYKCLLSYNFRKDVYARDNYIFAQKQGIWMPSYFFSWLVLSPSIIFNFLKNAFKIIIGKEKYEILWNKIHSARHI